MNTPREYTIEEVRAQFLDYARQMVEFWAGLPEKTVEERVSGAVFSLLAGIDGASGSLPGFVLAPAPHPSDKAYHIANGENWYPEAPVVKCNIAGGLHEGLYQ